MAKLDLSLIEVLPQSGGDPAFEQRETGLIHTPYKMESLFFSCIERGDLEQLYKIAQGIDALIVGRLSKNDTRQMQYAAVSCITLAIRSAIEGGMDENVAYNLSDKYIQRIDELDDPGRVFSFLSEKIEELTKAVSEVKQRAKFSRHTRLCIGYINKNLHNKITLPALAKECGLSCDYLSFLFKKETGLNINAYILKEKLKAARSLIKDKRDHKGVGFYFSFCSESYFISCFRKEFNVTPRQYANSLK